jgi:hypothetical protein
MLLETVFVVFLHEGEVPGFRGNVSSGTESGNGWETGTPTFIP